MKNTFWTKRLTVGVLTLSLLAGVVYTGHEVQQSQPQIEDNVGAAKGTKFSKTLYQTTATLNVRSGASTYNKVVTQLPKGTKVYSEYRIGTWYKVSYKGKTGYASGSYLKKVVKGASTPSSKPTWMSKESAENILKKEYKKRTSRSYVYTRNGRGVTEVLFRGTSNAKADLIVGPFQYLGALDVSVKDVGQKNYDEWKAALKIYNRKIKTYASTQIPAKYGDAFVKEVEKFALTSKRKQSVVKRIGGKDFVFSNTGEFIISPK